MQKHIKNKFTTKERTMTSQKKKSLTEEILASNISSATKKELLNILHQIHIEHASLIKDTFQDLSTDSKLRLLL
jgi:hypothetical protein